jgi:predicted O-linked N-acetylglucosamine transferase (SPINDLY family)
MLQRALALHQAGAATEAARLYDAILRIEPRHFDALHLWGVLEAQHRRLPEAERLIAAALDVDPRSAIAWSNRGNVLADLGRPTEALAAYDAALALVPDDAPSLANRGKVLRLLRRPEAALSSFDRALTLRPQDTETLNGRGLVLVALERLAAALASYARALALRPDHGEAATNRASVLRRLRQHQGALTLYRRVLAAGGAEAAALYNQGLTLQDLLRRDEALLAYRQALALAPGLGDAWNNASLVLMAMGLSEEGRRCVERAVVVSPGSTAAARNRLSASLYLDHTRSGNFLARAADFARRFGPATPLPPSGRLNDPERRLTIGIVSSDLHDHPVGHALRPVFEHRNRRDLALVCYAHERRDDEVARWFRASADAWRGIAGLTDREVALRVREDGVDVLAILAGFFDLNRPLVAAWRAAPVQISIFDGASSGVAAMDYILGDPVFTPEDGPERFIEEVMRVPVLHVHAPHADVPIAPRGGDAVMFGSFNNPVKYATEVLTLWGRILARLPQARLLLKFKDFYARAALRRLVLDGIARGGGDSDRVLFAVADEDKAAHLARYGGIDIALDCFPFTGATTTFEALWMGVPVVTLCAGGMLGRMSAAHLIPLGLDDLVATTPEAYVEAAIRLAADGERRRSLRASLRDRLLASPLMDGPAYARSLESLFRALWRRRVAGLSAERSGHRMTGAEQGERR